MFLFCFFIKKKEKFPGIKKFGIILGEEDNKALLGKVWELQS